MVGGGGAGVLGVGAAGGKQAGGRTVSSVATDARETAISDLISAYSGPSLRELLHQQFVSCNLTDRLSPVVYWKLCANHLRQAPGGVVVYSFSSAPVLKADLVFFHEQMRQAGHKVRLYYKVTVLTVTYSYIQFHTSP